MKKGPSEVLETIEEEPSLDELREKLRSFITEETIIREETGVKEEAGQLGNAKDFLSTYHTYIYMREEAVKSKELGEYAENFLHDRLQSFLKYYRDEPTSRAAMDDIISEQLIEKTVQPIIDVQNASLAAFNLAKSLQESKLDRTRKSTLSEEEKRIRYDTLEIMIKEFPEKLDAIHHPDEREFWRENFYALLKKYGIEPASPVKAPPASPTGSEQSATTTESLSDRSVSPVAASKEGGGMHDKLRQSVANTTGGLIADEDRLRMIGKIKRLSALLSTKDGKTDVRRGEKDAFYKQYKDYHRMRDIATNLDNFERDISPHDAALSSKLKGFLSTYAVEESAEFPSLYNVGIALERKEKGPDIVGIFEKECDAYAAVSPYLAAGEGERALERRGKTPVDKYDEFEQGWGKENVTAPPVDDKAKLAREHQRDAAVEKLFKEYESAQAATDAILKSSTRAEEEPYWRKQLTKMYDRAIEIPPFRKGDSPAGIDEVKTPSKDDMNSKDDMSLPSLGSPLEEKKSSGKLLRYSSALIMSSKDDMSLPSLGSPLEEKKSSDKLLRPSSASILPSTTNKQPKGPNPFARATYKEGTAHRKPGKNHITRIKEENNSSGHSR